MAPLPLPFCISQRILVRVWKGQSALLPGAGRGAPSPEALRRRQGPMDTSVPKFLVSMWASLLTLKQRALPPHPHNQTPRQRHLGPALGQAWRSECWPVNWGAWWAGFLVLVSSSLPPSGGPTRPQQISELASIQALRQGSVCPRITLAPLCLLRDGRQEGERFWRQMETQKALEEQAEVP